MNLLIEKQSCVIGEIQTNSKARYSADPEFLTVLNRLELRDVIFIILKNPRHIEHVLKCMLVNDEF